MKNSYIIFALAFALAAASAPCVFAQIDTPTDMTGAAAGARAKSSGAGKGGGVLGAISDHFTAEGETRHLEPFTNFALGVGLTNTSGGMASDFPIEIKKEKLILDFDKIAKFPAIAYNGADFNLMFAIKDTIRLELTTGIGGLGFALSGVDMRFDLNLDEDIFKLLANGIKEGDNFNFAAGISGAIFSQTFAGHWHNKDLLKIAGKPLFIGATLSHYIPILYIPATKVSINVNNTEDAASMRINGEATAYLAADIFDGQYLPDNAGGFDLSFQVEYALFPIFDVGITASNIPFIPSVLTASQRLVWDNKPFLEVTDLIGGSLEMDSNAITDFKRESNSGAKVIVRPMRWDFYALYRPLRKDFLVLRPNIGFTVLNPSEEGYFNIGLEAALNVGRIFTVSLFTGGYDGLCRNRLGLGLRLGPVANWYLGMEMRSQDYFSAWTAKGFGFELGLKWGGGFSGVTAF